MVDPALAAIVQHSKWHVDFRDESIVPWSQYTGKQKVREVCGGRRSGAMGYNGRAK